ncbi:MAG: gliding motility lipoprotein GldH [Tannerella sp.]|nr:gliding motility lipoprotein GldH [Tannerella sp.]
MNKLTAMISGMICLMSCDSAVVFMGFRHVVDKSWSAADEYTFFFDITDTSRSYNIAALLRNTDLYPADSITILYRMQHVNNVFADTIAICLKDESGKWKGRGISLFQTETFVLTNYFFADTGAYTVSISQLTSFGNLTGVDEVGLRVRSF